MSPSGVPEEVRKFIAEYVDSAEQLETLLLLHRDSERVWTPDEVAQAIYTVPQSAQRRLEALTALGLAASTGGDPPTYRYAPADPGLDRRVKALADTYRERRVAVINTIYAAPLDPVRTFADAFKLRKD